MITNILVDGKLFIHKPEHKITFQKNEDVAVDDDLNMIMLNEITNAIRNNNDNAIATTTSTAVAATIGANAIALADGAPPPSVSIV